MIIKWSPQKTSRIPGGCLVGAVRIRQLDAKETQEQHEQLRRAWLIKLVFRKHYKRCQEFR